jgi:hypothetical protein
MNFTDKKLFRITLPGNVEEVRALEFVITNNGTLVIIQSIDEENSLPAMAFAAGSWLAIRRIPAKPDLH